MLGRTLDMLGALLDTKTSASGVKLLRADDARGRCVAKASSVGDRDELDIAIAGVVTGCAGLEGCQSCAAHVGGLKDGSGGDMEYSCGDYMPVMLGSMPGEYERGRGWRAA